MVEHEMKFAVRGLDPVRQALREAGGKPDQGLTFEDNLVLDDAGGGLRATGRLLRLRRWGERWTLTFKGQASFRSGVKSRPEFETAIDDGAALLRVLGELGYSPVRRYQKRRESWSLGPVKVLLDETPMGSFVELEGDPSILAGAALRLGLDPGTAVQGTYVELWSRYREDHPDAPAEMLFP